MDEEHPLRQAQLFSESDVSKAPDRSSSLVPSFLSSIIQALLYSAAFSDVPWQPQHVSNQSIYRGLKGHKPILMPCPWLSVVPCFVGLPMRESIREGKTAESTASGKQISVSEPDHSRPGFASEGKQLNSPIAALPHGKCSFYSIKFPVTKVNGPCGICPKVSDASGRPAISTETGGDQKDQEEQRAQKWQATGKHWLMLHSLRV